MSKAYVHIAVIPEADSEVRSYPLGTRDGMVIWIDSLVSIHMRPETADLADRIAAAFTEAARLAREVVQPQVPA